MWRTPLRSKKGCFRCRQRRIKCGEEKPTCANCTRWNFECLWPDNNEVTEKETGGGTTMKLQAPRRRNSTLVTYQDSLLTVGYENFQDETQSQLVRSAIKFFGKYVNYGIEPEDGDESFCTTLALTTPWTRESLTAFSATAMSRWDKRFTSTAFKSYHATVTHLRFHLSSLGGSQADIYFATSVMFLGLMEYIAKGCPPAAFTHLSIVARMAITQEKLPSYDLQDPLSRWTVAMITLSLCLCGNLFMFEPRIYLLFEGNWEKLDSFFIDYAQPLADHKHGLREENLRTVIQLRINRLIYGEASADHVRDVLERIDVLENYILTPESTTSQSGYSANLIPGWFAETFMLRTYLAALADPNRCSGNEHMRLVVREWNDHMSSWMQTIDQEMPATQWLLPFTRLRMDRHIAVTGFFVTMICATYDLESFEALARMYNSCEIVLDENLEAKVNSVIRTIRHRKETTFCELGTKGYCNNRHDGMDILRSPANFFL